MPEATPACGPAHTTPVRDCKAATLYAGTALEHCADWVSLHFERPQRALSSAVVNGGLGSSSRWVNLRVSGDSEDAREPVSDRVASTSARWNWAANTVAMLTAASMNSLRVRTTSIHNQALVVAVTTGLANARRAGDRAEYRLFNDSVVEQGTINLAIATNLSLNTAVMVEAMMIATEAKTAVLEQHGIRSPVSGGLATGTGTDAMAIFSDPAGVSASFAGKHTLLGEAIGRLTLAAIADSISQQGACVEHLDMEKPS